MMKEVFLFGFLVIFVHFHSCNAACYSVYPPVNQIGCSYAKGYLQPGETSDIFDCERCTCGLDSVLSCCDEGPHYTQYPDTCTVIVDNDGCEKLVSIINPLEDCKDGPIGATGK